MKLGEKIFIGASFTCAVIYAVGTVTYVIEKFNDKKKERVELERRLTRAEDKLIDCDSRSFINKLEIDSINKKLKILEGKKN